LTVPVTETCSDVGAYPNGSKKTMRLSATPLVPTEIDPAVAAELATRVTEANDTPASTGVGVATPVTVATSGNPLPSVPYIVNTTAESAPVDVTITRRGWSRTTPPLVTKVRFPAAATGCTAAIAVAEAADSGPALTWINLLISTSGRWP
jgi:hypothetical protein